MRRSTLSALFQHDHDDNAAIVGKMDAYTLETCANIKATTDITIYTIGFGGANSRAAMASAARGLRPAVSTNTVSTSLRLASRERS